MINNSSSAISSIAFFWEYGASFKINFINPPRSDTGARFLNFRQHMFRYDEGNVKCNTLIEQKIFETSDKISN